MFNKKKQPAEEKDVYINSVPPLSKAEVVDLFNQKIDTINNEFHRGLSLIAEHPKSVTFFGSARFKPGSEWYEKTRTLASKIAKETGYTIVSGGGPGIMEAANRGAKEAGGKSIGYTIKLPMEQFDNPYLDDHRSFDYFFVRKMLLNYSAETYIVCPGGFGTLDEFFGILTLIQTKKIPEVPIILYGKKFWNPLIKYFHKFFLKKYSTVSKNDFNLFKVTDDIDEIVKIVKHAKLRKE